MSGLRRSMTGPRHPANKLLSETNDNIFIGFYLEKITRQNRFQLFNWLKRMLRFQYGFIDFVPKTLRWQNTEFRKMKFANDIDILRENDNKDFWALCLEKSIKRPNRSAVIELAHQCITTVADSADPMPGRRRSMSGPHLPASHSTYNVDSIT